MNVRWLVLACLFFSAAASAVVEDAHRETSPVSPKSGESPKQTTPAVARSRGELLYENHCTSCHASRVHVRDNRHATSASEVESWVRRWAGELRLGWGDDDVNDVTSYLIRRYYKFSSMSPR